MQRKTIRAAIALCLAIAGGAVAVAQEMHRHHGAMEPSMMMSPAVASASPSAASPAAPPVFLASTAKPFVALMDDAMAVMDDGMKRAPMNGQSDHDFITMMMPHHQGAVDMAKAVLLYSQDHEIRNLALGIIADQQVEIQVMQAWLQHHPGGAAQ